MMGSSVAVNTPVEGKDDGGSLGLPPTTPMTPTTPTTTPPMNPYNVLLQQQDNPMSNLDGSMTPEQQVHLTNTPPPATTTPYTPSESTTIKAIKIDNDGIPPAVTSDNYPNFNISSHNFNVWDQQRPLYPEFSHQQLQTSKNQNEEEDASDSEVLPDDESPPPQPQLEQTTTTPAAVTTESPQPTTSLLSKLVSQARQQQQQQQEIQQQQQQNPSSNNGNVVNVLNSISGPSLGQDVLSSTENRQNVPVQSPETSTIDNSQSLGAQESSVLNQQQELTSSYTQTNNLDVDKTQTANVNPVETSSENEQSIQPANDYNKNSPTSSNVLRESSTDEPTKPSTAPQDAQQPTESSNQSDLVKQENIQNQPADQAGPSQISQEKNPSRDNNIDTSNTQLVSTDNTNEQLLQTQPADSIENTLQVPSPSSANSEFDLPNLQIASTKDNIERESATQNLLEAPSYDPTKSSFDSTEVSTLRDPDTGSNEDSNGYIENVTISGEPSKKMSLSQLIMPTVYSETDASDAKQSSTVLDKDQNAQIDSFVDPSSSNHIQPSTDLNNNNNVLIEKASYENGKQNDVANGIIENKRNRIQPMTRKNKKHYVDGPLELRSTIERPSDASKIRQYQDASSYKPNVLDLPAIEDAVDWREILKPQYIENPRSLNRNVARDQIPGSSFVEDESSRGEEKEPYVDFIKRSYIPRAEDILQQMDNEVLPPKNDDPDYRRKRR